MPVHEYARVGGAPAEHGGRPPGGEFLVVIDHVLALNYLKPEPRRRVVKLQRQLIKAEMSAHYQVRE